MAIQIKQKKGYPDSTGKMHDSHADAMKEQAGINLLEAMESEEVPITIVQFIKRHPDVIQDYIKYNNIKPAVKPKAKRKPKTKQTAEIPEACMPLTNT